MAEKLDLISASSIQLTIGIIGKRYLSQVMSFRASIEIINIKINDTTEVIKQNVERNSGQYHLRITLIRNRHVRMRQVCLKVMIIYRANS